MKKKYNSKFYKSPIIVDSINGDILVYVKTNKWREVIYSWYNTVEKKCHIPYINKCLLWWFIHWIPKSVLILWLWGGSYAKYLEDHVNDINITWVDIDEAMIDISEKEIKLTTTDIICDSSENAVKELKKLNKKYDLILLDCYLWDWEIPVWVTYDDFLQNCKDLLTTNWILSINFSEFFLDNEAKDIVRVIRYREMHKILKTIFWGFFTLFLVWEENWSNSMWIYNLNKFYTAEDYKNNYLECVEENNIIFDQNIISDIYIDKGLFFQ